MYILCFLILFIQLKFLILFILHRLFLRTKTFLFIIIIIIFFHIKIIYIFLFVLWLILYSFILTLNRLYIILLNIWLVLYYNCIRIIWFRHFISLNVIKIWFLIIYCNIILWNEGYNVFYIYCCRYYIFLITFTHFI